MSIENAAVLKETNLLILALFFHKLINTCNGRPSRSFFENSANLSKYLRLLSELVSPKKLDILKLKKLWHLLKKFRTSLNFLEDPLNSTSTKGKGDRFVVC